ncbi:MAG TPA: M23 family metallopeptidase [Saprospiraceae bacterium]|jgi:murein DD-endopeptidase MepM/ murein hydrolase activator NlpD|nr:M23 family metallopeptidase [Saprospiraceae bacterium]HMR88131.1 M23 family metallopeptidase [Saprospiraceae bacterium]HMU02530.1 M23 family metallopeptidase [Saprospiraceae bacterium]
MKNVKYVYNEHTLQYEKHRLSRKDKLRRSFYFTSAVLLTAVLMFVFAYQYFPTPKEKLVQKEKEQLEFYLSHLTEEYEVLSEKIESLHEKDGQINRMILGAKPIDDGIWNGGIGGHDKYAFLGNQMETGKMLKENLERVDELKLKIEIQKNSLDSLYKVAVVKEKKLASIPSIKPVKETALRKDVKFLSGFGTRIHPIHKLRRFHKGIDFTAPTGTDIQATGNGRVASINKEGSGYGKHVLIDHGYGYKTLYAHMHTISVKEGAIVKKGQKIGLVGSTGSSTGAHLHYEVWLNGVAINPIDYCLDGLTAKEYQDLVKRASTDNQSLD